MVYSPVCGWLCVAVGISNNAVKMMLEAVRQIDLGCGRWDVAGKGEGWLHGSSLALGVAL